MDYKYLVFEGGGVKGISYCGALKRLNDDLPLEKFEGFAGTSAGAIFATMLALDIPLKKICTLTDVDFPLYIDDTLWIVKIYRLLAGYGMHKKTKIMNFFKNFLEESNIDKDITFSEAFMLTGKELVLVGCDLNNNEAVYFHHGQYPHLPVLKALMCSVCIPFYFFPEKINNNYYVDGGLVDNFPLWIFNDIPKLYEGQIYDIPKNPINEETLGMKLLTKNEANDKKVNLCRFNTTNIIEFAKSIIATLLLQIERSNICDTYIENTIPIKTGDISGIDFDLTKEEKVFLLNNGTKSVEEFLKKRE